MTILILIILGLAFGSFVNALVWRLHEQETKKPKNKKLSIINGRSMCVSCKHELSANDLVPVLSWVSLRGKCRYCKTKISWQYPLVEALTSVIFVGSYIYWPYEFGVDGWVRLIIWLVFVVGFMALAVYDLRWMILPNRLIFPLVALGVVQVLLLSGLDTSFELIVEAFFGVLVCSGFFYVLFQVSGGKWIGGGDVRLGFVIGLIIGGLLPATLMLFLAALAGSVFSIPLLLMGKGRDAKVPFGPFLIGATVIVYLFGGPIIDWYQSIFLLT